MRPSGCASIGVVTKGMDVHATLSVGIVAGDIPRHSRLGALGGLLESDGALDIGVAAEDSNYSNVISLADSSIVL